MTAHIVGAAQTPFGKFLDVTIPELTARAVQGALDDAGCDPADIGFVAFGNAVSSVMTGQAMIQGQLALAGTPLAGAPIVNVENACATGSTAVHLAAMAVASGQTELAMAIGVEKMTHEVKERAFDALGAALDVNTPVAEGATRASVFMGLYAIEAHHYMARSGAPVEAFAEAAVQAHHHGSLNPNAQYRKPYSREEVLESRLIADPLTLLMCSPIGDGAGAIIVASEAAARRLGVDSVRIRGMAIRSGRYGDTGDLVRLTAEQAYDKAGIGPAQIDVVELHDAAASAKPIILEELALAEHNKGWRRVLDGDTALGGALPVNTGGGLVSRGHPIGATGVAQLVELADQLRGRSGERQVPGARFGLAETLGGAIEIEPYTGGTCAITVLESAQ
jgi:acetyl-CoA acetyltransferase